MLQRTIDAGGSLLLTGAALAEAAARRCRSAQGMGCVLSVALQGDRGATIGMLAVAAADPTAITPERRGLRAGDRERRRHRDRALARRRGDRAARRCRTR